MEPLITIIIPVYNVEKYLKRCVDSVLAQTYRNFEVILIDDGSPDKSGELCDLFAEDDCRIRVFHTQNGGVSNARNIGLDNANGDYITFVDSDDYIHPDYLAELLKAVMEHKSSKIAVCSFYHVNSECTEFEEESKRCNFFDKSEINVFREYNYVKAYVLKFIWCAIYDKEIIKKIRFRSGLHLAEDSLFMAEAISLSPDIAIVNKSLYYYVNYAQSASHGGFDERKATFVDSWLKIIDVYSKHPECTPDFISKCYITLYDKALQGLRDISKEKRLNKRDKVYCKLLNAIRGIYWDLIKARVGWKTKIKFTLLAISPRLYMLLF